MTQQLVLGFPVRVDYSAEAYVPLPGHERIWQALEGLKTSPGAYLVLGPAGSGKTHTLTLWAASVGAEVLAAEAFSANDLARRVLVVDGLERLTAAGQEALFHRLQRHQAELGQVLLSCGVGLGELSGLPDLLSRLKAMPQGVLPPLGEHELELIALKLAHDAQMVIKPDVLAYLMRYAERSPAALRTLMAQLNQLSLQEKRAISLPLVKKVLPDVV